MKQAFLVMDLCKRDEIMTAHGLATPELLEVHNDDNVVDIISCVALSEFTSMHY